LEYIEPDASQKSMWAEFKTGPYARNVISFRAKRQVVSHGVRHIAIDVLPREPIAFRTVCNQDVIEDEHAIDEATECERCRRFDVGPAPRSVD
jgi:hypothetical protein